MEEDGIRASGFSTFENVVSKKLGMRSCKRKKGSSSYGSSKRKTGVSEYGVT